MSTIRVLDLGLVPSIRSQTVYHAVAHAMTPATPDTLVLVSPTDPYVCIGFHQELEREVDLSYCREHGLPVYRREVGGGAVYLDRNQLFAQWIFHRDHLPASVEDRFELYIRPLVETYRKLGIQAYHRPVNDIHVAGRKIGGTGAASMGEAEVVVGSLMFDFDCGVMSRVLRVPSEKMRDKLHRSIQDYMTTMTRELGWTPEREMVKAVYLDRCRAALGAAIVAGVLTEREEAAVRRWDERLSSPEWLHQRGTMRRKGVKVSEDVRVVEGSHKAPGGLIRVTARLRHGRVEDIDITGDFTLLPASRVADLERAVRGIEVVPEVVLSHFREVYEEMDLWSPGVTAEDFAFALLAATGPVAADGRRASAWEDDD